MELGSFWETAANFATVMGAIIAVVMAWCRYKFSTPLEKLFMEGADRVLIQLGAIVNYIGIVILWMAIMNAGGLLISSLLSSNMLNEKLKEMTKADGADIYSSIFAMLGLLFLLIWTQTFRLKSDSNDYHMDKKTMRLAEKSETAGFNDLIKIGIITGEIATIIVLIFIIWSRIINRAAIVFIPIKITLDLVSDVICRIRYRWIWKLIGEYTFAGSSTIGILVCVSDFAYLFCLCFVGKIQDNFLGNLATIIFCSSAFTFLRMKENELKDSNSESFSQFKVEYTSLFLLYIGMLMVPYSLRYNGIDMSNIMACIMGKSSLSLNMNIKMILLVEMVVILLSLGGIKSIKTSVNIQEVTLRLVNLSTGKSYFAYRVCDGQLLYGEDREYRNQSSSHFIPMADIYAGKYTLIDANIELKELCIDEAEAKRRVKIFEIDVSTIEARRDKGHNSIEGSLSDDSLGESGGVNISLIEDRLQNNQIDKESEILVYCEEEQRLQMAAWRLIAMGYKSVYICKARKCCRWSWDGKILCAEFVLRK